VRYFLVFILGLLIVHLLAVGALVGWLSATDRLNKVRLEQVVDTFRLPIEEEKRQEQEAARLALEIQQKQEQAKRLEAVADGPVTMQQRLDEQEQANDLSLHRLERLQRETSDLSRNVESALALLARQKAELEQQKQTFQAFVERQSKLMQDEDFRQAVAMYEKLKPKQVKQMFQTLIGEGKTIQVVDYLAAMQLRKAASVLGEFKDPQDIPQATALIQQLRDRGIYVLNDPPASQENQTS
jgi:hypothetical protein